MIANHALLLSDLVSRSRVLPDYDVLVVDEAHHLEDEATQQLGWRLGGKGASGRQPAGIVSRSKDIFSRYAMPGASACVEA